MSAIGGVPEAITASPGVRTDRALAGARADRPDPGDVLDTRAIARRSGGAHSGFLAPLLLAVTARSASYPELLAGLAMIGFILLIGASVHAARNAHHDPSRPDPTPQELTWEE